LFFRFLIGSHKYTILIEVFKINHGKQYGFPRNDIQVGAWVAKSGYYGLICAIDFGVFVPKTE